MSAVEQITKAANKQYYRKSNQGYLLVWNKDHPKAYSGRVLEQVMVFEEYHKCCILRWGVVHHINEVKTDNRIENLQGMTRAQHVSLHQVDKRIPANRKCCKCGLSKTNVGKDGTAKWSVVDRAANLFHCNACYSHEQRQKHKEERREYSRIYHYKHKKQRLEYAHEYYQKHQKERIEYSREYYQKHKKQKK